MNLTSEQTDYTFPAAHAATSVNVATNTLSTRGTSCRQASGRSAHRSMWAVRFLADSTSNVDYWAIDVDKDNFQLATTPPNGGAPTAVNLTSHRIAAPST